MKDVLGEALLDYYHQRFTGKLWVNRAEHSSAGQRPDKRKSAPRADIYLAALGGAYRYAPKEEMPVNVYFREAEDMPELEWVALQQCRGKTLDIGAGAGSHCLVLQEMGLDVSALDISPGAVAVMKERGVQRILHEDFFALGGDAAEGVMARAGGGGPVEGSFDTLLLLMNGIGLAGTLDGLRRFFSQAKLLLRPGGQLIFDSCDIAYMYKGKPPAGLPEYYGEILYQYSYKRQVSDWFKWLFIDRKTLTEVAASVGWKTELLFEDECDQYLVRCTYSAKI